MYVIKIDLPTGVAFFTGKKRVVQGSESPGLTDDRNQARLFADEEEATKYCKMLVKKYDLDFYYSQLPDDEDVTLDTDIDFVVDIPEDITREIDAGMKPDEF